jgi:C1A family cysteine protease
VIPSEAEIEKKDRHLQSLPASIDWRQYGVVSYVKNQGQCGSCYCFATIDALEALIAIKHKLMYNFSEQQLLDCTEPYGNNWGCQGGFVTYNWEYLMQNKIMLNSEYPYVAYRQTC